MELIHLILGLLGSNNRLITKENERATQCGSCEKFILYYARSYLCNISVLLLIVSLVVTAALQFGDVGMMPWLIFGVPFTAALIYIISRFRWKLTYDKYYIEYKPGFGREKSFQYNEIRQVKVRKHGFTVTTDDASISIDNKIIGHNLLLDKLVRYSKSRSQTQ